MKRVLGVVFSAVAVVVLSAPLGPVAQAATGAVVVFSVETSPLGTYENPEGCHALPPGAHVLANLTDGDVTIYSDAWCVARLVSVKRGYGTHVPTLGAAFRA